MTYLGGSAAALAADRNTWQGRANNAWGTSRVWNSGSSFETDLATMTTDRNNWQASSTTWQGRANNAWGASRVWNSGESWEAAYTRVLPPSAPVVLHVSFSGALPGDREQAALQVNRTGYWATFANINFSAPPGQIDVQLKMTYNGDANHATPGNGTQGVAGLVRVPTSAASQAGWSSGYDASGGYALVTNGNWVTFRTNSTSNTAANGDFWAVFIPTATYPH